MQLNLFWFILAGFLLGFTTSTLWEWFHFRRERLKLRDRRIRELEARLREQEQATRGEASASASFDEDDSSWSPPWSAPEYRSPGIFLETEEMEPEPDALAGAPGVSEPGVSAPVDFHPSEAGADRVDPGNGRRTPAVPPPRPDFAERIAAVTSARPPSATPPSSTPVSPAPLPAPDSITPRTTFGMRSASPLVQSNHTSPPIKPGVAPKRTENYPDDLSKIKGIGDVYKKRLYAAGIYTWHQIAETDLETLRAATKAYPSSNVEEWPVQARQLAEKHGRRNIYYTGAPPDDLTLILGIGPISAQSLYRVGICTFEQLAETPVESLAALFPIAVAGDQPDFASWVQQARDLAARKAQ